MGQLFSRLFSFLSFWSIKQHKILLLGLDGAGKTTVLYWVKLHTEIVTIPTVGFNVEEISVPQAKVSFVAWDIGGQDRLRSVWSKYYSDSHGLVYVVDSADTRRLDEAAAELQRVMNDPLMQQVPFVVLANKQDLPQAANKEEVIRRLGLSELEQSGHPWRIRMTVAINGVGLMEAMEDLATLIKQRANKTGVGNRFA